MVCFFSKDAIFSKIADEMMLMIAINTPPRVTRPLTKRKLVTHS